MLPNNFYEMYMETNDSPPPVQAHEEIPIKDAYSRAEVEEIVAKKISEALESLKTPPVVEQVEPPVVEQVEPPVDETIET